MTHFETHQEEIDFLKTQGFPVNPLNQSANSLEEVWEIKNSLGEKRYSLNYPIDGLVVKLNDNNLVQKLGVVGKTNRGWSAIKFPANQATTILRGVEWQVGRTGKITPVANLEDTDLDRTVVKRASLHNYKEFKSKNLVKGDTLIIQKAGDIIPEVVEVMLRLRPKDAEVIEAPETCPSCQHKLVKSETKVDLYCPNEQNCPAQVLARLAYWASRGVANIDGLSEKQIEKFIEKFQLHDIPDLYSLDYQTILDMENFGAKSVQNLEESIQKSTNMPAHKFLSGLGIEGIGPEVAKLIITKISEKLNS